jgi:hypothetical protein
MPALPFKPNQDRRHHIPRQKHKVTNWPVYEAGLGQRGSQSCYSPLTILTALTLRAVFRLAFRQTERLIGSVIGLLGPTSSPHTSGSH